MSRILVVDDEPKIRRIVASYLQQEGFEVSEAGDGPSAVEMAERLDPDVIILDVMLPGFDGIEALRQIRTKSDVYVIMLTARSEETDKLIGLSVGADDYVTKPFSARELVARVKAVLRRSRQGSQPETDRITVGSLTLDEATRVVTVDGAPIDLTALEFDLLGALAASPGRVYSRGQLIEKVWGWDFFGDERLVDVHVRKIRQKIGDDPVDPRFIATVRGVGYRFVDPS
ncbi:MAG: response regulator transcription factor [Actinomycetota bacterium]|nr:response regulator transcription factor [Actinomycetota bacterium]